MSICAKHILLEFFFSVFFLFSLLAPATAEAISTSTNFTEVNAPVNTGSTLFLLEKSGKYGYINNQGDTILPLSYDALSLPDAKGHIIVKEKDTYGIFDQTGHQILPPAFKDLKIGFDGNIYASQGKLQGVFNSAGQPLLPIEFESCQPCTPGLILAKKDNLWHYYDSISGKIAIEQGFDEASPFVEGLARIKCGDKYGYIDQQGKIVIPCQYKDAVDFSEGLAAVATKDRWGFIDPTGKMIIPENFSGYESGFKEGLAIMHGSSAHDYIDKKGNLAFSAPYEIVYPFKDGLAEINVEKVSFSWGGLISSALSSTLNVYMPDEDRNLIASNMKRGFIDKTGKQLIPTTYDFVSTFQDGLAKVILHDKAGFVDHQGCFVIPADYQELSFFQEDFAAAKKDGKWSFIDKNNRALTAFTFEQAADFKDKLAAVKTSTGWGFINYTGDLVIKPKYDSVSAFSGDIAIVKFKGATGAINRDGHYVLPAKMEYQDIESFQNGLGAIKIQNKWGLIKTDGTLFLPAVYDSIRSISPAVN